MENSLPPFTKMFGVSHRIWYDGDLGFNAVSGIYKFPSLGLHIGSWVIELLNKKQDTCQVLSTEPSAGGVLTEWCCSHLPSSFQVYISMCPYSSSPQDFHIGSTQCTFIEWDWIFHRWLASHIFSIQPLFSVFLNSALLPPSPLSHQCLLWKWKLIFDICLSKT